MTEPVDRRAETEAIFSEATDETRERRRRIAERERIEATATPVRQRVSRTGLAVALPILLVLVTLGLTGWSFESLFEPRLSPQDALREAQKTLDDLVVQVEAFRQDFKQLPEGLIEVGIPQRGKWSYTVIGKDQYRIEGVLYGHHVIHDSTKEPKPPSKQP